MKSAWRWTLPFALAGAAALALSPGCHRRPSRGPEWVGHIPAACEAAVSIQAGWALEEPRFQAILARYPEAEQSLELILKKASIAPRTETGRITLYVMGGGKGPAFLLRFGGFRNPDALGEALSQAFPREGALETRGSSHPLMVVLDAGQTHIRAVTDTDRSLWVGDLGTLAELLNSTPRTDPTLARAAEWIDPEAPLQAYVNGRKLGARAQETLGTGAPHLPEGIRTLLWTARPLPGASYRLELALAGEREGIRQVVPWLEKFVALATSVGGSSRPAPELSQSSDRAVLRCQLSEAQLKAILERLGSPGTRP
nr:hypothetical protein [uncultured Holophaga sp.]